MSNIAPLGVISDNLDLAAKFFRVMEKTGVSSQELTLPVNDKTARDNLAMFLRAGCPSVSAPVSVHPKDFLVYLQCEVGGKSKEELLTEFEACNMFVSDWAKDFMSKPAWKPGQMQTIKFARATVRDLGFTDSKKLPTTKQVWARIKELGHDLCEPCDGPAIRLSLKDQPKGDYFWTAMEQIAVSLGFPYVFDVYRSDGGESWLLTSWVAPGLEWRLGRELVFRLSK